MKPQRVVLYGHDTVGLGHLRRNLALAAAISQTPEHPDVLLVSGIAEAAAYDLPPGVDVVTVPSARKDAGGGYRSRRLGCGLEALVALRQATITAAVEAFNPDLFVVDKVPHGFGGELRSLLPRLRLGRRAGDGTRVVLGLRDVLDDPAAARAEWRRLRVNDALRRDVDEVWVYGDRTVHDLGEACAVPPVLRQRFRYTGYLSAGRIPGRERPPRLGHRTPYVLCTVGGGQDGAALARAFAAAALPTGVVGVLVTGPQMAQVDRHTLERAACGRRDLAVIEFSTRVERWVADASAVVAMGGYNTVAEILATTSPALIVPRTRPRAEQAVRADALAERGSLDRLAPGALGPAALSGWIADAVVRRRTPRVGIDLDGIATVGRLTSSLLTTERVNADAG